MTLADDELMRARWRRALTTLALDSTARPDFATGGLAQRLADPTVQVVLLPADSDETSFEFDDSFWAWTEAFRSILVAGRPVLLGQQQYPTAHAAALVRGYGRQEPWQSYFAVHRSGALEMGLGDRGGWDRIDRDRNPKRAFNLVSTMVYTWALLAFASELQERNPSNGPFQLTVALRDTREALLGNLAEGWAEPGSFENSAGGCPDPNLRWSWTLNELPDEEGQRDMAFQLGNRLEDAWGVRQRRYLASRGPRQGQFDHQRIAD